jgi:hypothetical protein
MSYKSPSSHEPKHDIDVSHVFDELRRISEMSVEERVALAERVRRDSVKYGRVLVDRAIREKVFGRSEWLYFQELGLGYVEMDCLLTAYFDSISKSQDYDKFGLLTSVNSPIWRNKDFIFERFKLKVISMDELMELKKSGVLRGV